MKKLTQIMIHLLIIILLYLFDYYCFISFETICQTFFLKLFATSTYFLTHRFLSNLICSRFSLLQLYKCLIITH